ncbi:PSP1 domain-containing protein [Pseudobacteriovorax antillogorgiicola]|uniref:Cell fate regulator YaaT, PSP1 superfamily (Controls sporulation, competence, biofilm development) n=1 Tax=Pseudobacteriovorax antillogorgiicola TaxID=1513793 RepID=A0A1Y6BCN6_9BACT|nr:regulatory iron-sulfur-containing complex subunit RicT [Pseudobacteriovorax antillogorgiicola]TCS58854.1 cell fate regulator YaaT (PSP1 superfamily) [Pseudobacteriovorax antillogorgiicola]SME93995.1 Cell fate regulator YaaT, PSP1 superfamily (controls sporulation, competence, biofilm development) [Pseudobacteriovorax antillogorgiicola]
MTGMNIVGVQFRRAGKIYDFNAAELLLKLGDRVVVETERGLSLAEVKRVAFEAASDRDPDSLKPVVRIATKKDLDTAGRLDPDHAEKYSKEKIKELGLEMHVINVEIQFGGNKVIIYFSAPGRVDFRELVKELASGLKTRVELKQVGARDEAKLSGGIGICGREFCCSSFLREFVPVSIKMAKNQNLALNPSKVSGGCGRLLCCLTYEDETYSVLRQKLLPKGTRVKTPEDGYGDVLKGDILNQVCLVELDTGDQKSLPLNDLEVVEAKEGVDDDWGDDIDFDDLMPGSDNSDAAAVAKLEQEEQVESGSKPRGQGHNRERSGNRPKRGRGPRGRGRSSGSGSGSSSSSSDGKPRRNQSGDGRKGESSKRRGPRNSSKRPSSPGGEGRRDKGPKDRPGKPKKDSDKP